ncbi:MAG: hypothetical protein IPK16_28835 [Anaerolineales bacterium]|nr:hypothetical protein [Anaerolineales bacterium]
MIRDRDRLPSALSAEGLQQLLEQMHQGRVPVAVAGGTGNPEAPIGTDPAKVLAAIEAVYSHDGVIVLMDLGSAIMSAEVALEWVAPEQRPHIFLCEAPLVEGAFSAAVTAANGGSIDAVFAEACGAIGPSAQLTTTLLPAVTVQPKHPNAGTRYTDAYNRRAQQAWHPRPPRCTPRLPRRPI